MMAAERTDLNVGRLFKSRNIQGERWSYGFSGENGRDTEGENVGI